MPPAAEPGSDAEPDGSGGEPAGSDGEPGAAEDPFGQARVCAGVAQPLLLDFEDAGDSPNQGVFGDFQSTLSGGTYVYPDAIVAEDEAELPGLTSDVTEGDWHIAGSVTQSAGFGLFFDCEQLDASRFVGLAFRVQGSIASSNLLEFIVRTAANEPSRAWSLENGGSAEPSFGRCTPAQNEFDGTCFSARVAIEVTEESREVFVPFAELGGGRPEPNPNPSEITAIAWALPNPVVGATGSIEPYAVDLRLDDIRFVAAD
jgi:hypothetical protein